MRRLIPPLAALLATVMVLALTGEPAHHATSGLAGQPSRAFAQALGFLSAFDGTPASPEPWRGMDWDVVVNVSDAWSSGAIQVTPTEVHHGSDCGPPPATHQATSVDDLVFLCKGHIMTSIDHGYGVIYLTPNQLVDFSQGETVIRWDMSTLRSSGRDWVDLWITPFDQNLVVPVEEWLPAYQGEPRSAIHIRMDGSEAGTIFKGFVIQEHQASQLAGVRRGYESVLTPSAERRDTFELQISRTRVRFGMPAYDLWWVDASMQDLGWDRGIVQLGHHSYDSNKGCDRPCSNTWHWDNVSISSAVPFTMLRADQRVVSPRTTAEVTFAQPAPENAFLRFAGVGNNLAVSYDGGQTWQPAQRQPQEKDKGEHFASYWTPVPAGVSRVQLRGERFWGGPWMIQDVSIWSAP